MIIMVTTIISEPRSEGQVQAHLSYLKWRRSLIGKMIEAENHSSCLRAITEACNELGREKPASLQTAVGSIGDGHQIGDLSPRNPIMESDGTALDEG